MSTTTNYGGAVVMTTCAHARVWRERPVTRRLAPVTAPVQGMTLPVAGLIAGQSAKTGPVAFPAGADLGIAIAPNSMDVPPFRTGRPPV